MKGGMNGEIGDGERGARVSSRGDVDDGGNVDGDGSGCVVVCVKC